MNSIGKQPKEIGDLKIPAHLLVAPSRDCRRWLTTPSNFNSRLEIDQAEELKITKTNK
jgi:hypothetical protein